jgi:cell division protein FtsI (penicillin-binding protein 3)
MLPSKRERMLAQRRRFMLAVWLLANVVVVARAVHVQVFQTAMWRDAAEAQHQTTTEIAPPRGRILDRDGVPLAESREVVKISIAPAEIRDVAEVRKLLRSTLHLTAAQASRYTDPKDPWGVIPGDFDPSVLESLAGVRGVHIDHTYKRFYPRDQLARGVLGAVLEGQGIGGIEQVYENVLRGQPGRQIAARDNQGRVIPGGTLVLSEPVPGGDVRLTLDLDLQEIAHEALADALETTKARGGDVLVTNPRTGEILAMVSAGAGRMDGLSAINAPYEPGSTIKPFTVSAILESGVGSLDDLIDTGNGVWQQGGRRITDTSAHGLVSLAEVLRVSSNVGTTKAALEMAPGIQFEKLRDFGFGVQTGILLPGEVPGLLKHPRDWGGQSQASMAMGYEISVTPIQMAMGYGALANDGVLMEPRLVREVRDNAGALLERQRPRAVRQAVSAEVAREVSRVLVEVVEEGTGTAARLEAFQVAGKTGTSRIWADGTYNNGRYFASFAAFFPADDPQLVVFVKLDSPKGAYYGGATAAPVSRATMEAALATWSTPLDQRALMASARRASSSASVTTASRPASSGGAVRFASANLPAPSAYTAPAPTRASIDLPSVTEDPEPRKGADGSVPVPDVSGLAGRVAARRLHRAGLRVAWDGGAEVTGSIPAAGSRALPGDTIRLQTRTSARP